MQAQAEHLVLDLEDRITWLLRRQGRNKTELAAALGTSTQQLRRWVNRKMPVDVLAAIADELGTTMDFLAGRTDDPRPLPPTNPDDSGWFTRSPSDLQEPSLSLV